MTSAMPSRLVHVSLYFLHSGVRISVRRDQLLVYRCRHGFKLLIARINVEIARVNNPSKKAMTK